VIIRKSSREIEKIAAAGALVAETIAHTGVLLRPGVTTDELDAAAGAFIREHGGVPTSKGYKGYPRAICISVNDVVVHGIPGRHRVSAGDLVTIDVGVTLDGLIADSAYTFAVGPVDEEAQRLLDVAQDASRRDRQAVVGNRVEACRTRPGVVEGAGFSVVRSLVGHGVGRHYHEDPHIPNFGEPGRGPRLSEGMTIAIEPMITAGESDVTVMDDGWTIRTVDGSMSAHFEHTVAITPMAAHPHAPSASQRLRRSRSAALRLEAPNVGLRGHA
jgi:methionyl aminopeptidase